MLKIVPYDRKTFTSGVEIADAYDVKVTQEINGDRLLEFSYPPGEKSELIEENKIVICEGQGYRIMKVTKSRGERAVLKAECSHVYNADAPNIHIQNIPDMIGVTPTEVLETAFEDTPFSLMSDSALGKLGMKRVDYDGFLIDFFSADKTNPYDVVNAVIECCGKGEIYADNYKIALVERIGSDTGIRLDLTKNMQGISIERDMTDLTTVIFPYGKDDLHIGSVNGGKQYIKSPNASVYGIREGYSDYSDYTDPSELLERAQWEFSPQNENRIDVPCINITGTFAQLSKLAKYGADEEIHIGDGVKVIDGSAEISERVTRLESYPYQSDSAVVSIGRVRRDLFFYLRQMNKLSRLSGKTTTSKGKIRASSVSGTLTNMTIQSVSESGSVSVGTDCIEISANGTVRAVIGVKDGKFVFEIKDGSGNNAVSLGIDASGSESLGAEKISIGGSIIAADADGRICINGIPIVTES